ncbi:uncharacterized protein LOC129292171 [Prosopis cineraria]|uniref:uncharacterized protein LOC129292171 n=1 Tax=Prosopis cineraria TaxID=364024 RepID=UPI002410030A|nr:uncharacterized protein LOC129292171 [Prosopis cineraria]
MMQDYPVLWFWNRLPHSLFSNLKNLTVTMCGFVKLIPFHVLRSLNHLEDLVVRDCYILEVIFDLEELNDYNGEIQPLVVVPLKTLILLDLPELQNVWSNNNNAPQGLVSFRCLQEVIASSCEKLNSIFPASIAKDMSCLEELKIKDCSIDVIVANQDGQASESVVDDDTLIVFPRLTFLYLDDLPNLRNFYPHRHRLKWPCLEELYVVFTDLDLFENEASSSSSAIHHEEMKPDSKYPLLSHEEDFPKLEVLYLEGEEARMMLNIQLPKSKFPKVKDLNLLQFGRTTNA